MHYHLRDHIYIAQFQDELIILDTKQDKYTVCFQKFSESLVDLLEGKLSFSEEKLFLSKLIDESIIEKKSTPYPFYIDKKIDSDGVSNVDWSLPLENKKVSLNSSVLRAFLTLLKVNFYIKVRGFYSTIRVIKKSCKSQSIYIVPQDEELRDLANIVNKACLIYPIRTKCLEWAMTFILLALKKKWKCNLEIGIQNYPFMAHAWVECDGKVVMDSQDLREGLAIILNEPFRKLTI
ncbi:MAG: lasso peptide biosynthesis B2 protein [Alphaproteobacteria bacterium]|nr:lasso peptide biosynthesis B2 protein [Alphaproteobacteria bacterium]